MRNLKFKVSKRKLQKAVLLFLIALMVLLFAIVLTGCQILEPLSKSERAIDNKPILVNMLPTFPEFPAFPQLEWQDDNGRQSISNEDAVKFLDYWENDIAEYQFEVKKYRDSLEVVLEAL